MWLKVCFTLLLVLTMTVQAEGFYLSSSDIQGQIASDQVFNSFGCSGNNISPQLSW